MNCSEQNFENYMDMSIKFKKGSIVVVISYHYYHYCCMTPCACACGLIIFWIHAISQTDVFISAHKVYSEETFAFSPFFDDIRETQKA